MARRTEEIKGVVGPVQEKLGEDGERDRAPGARAQAGPGRARADGPPARRGRRHAARGDRQPRLGAQAPRHAGLVGRDPAAQRGRDGRHGRALRLPRAEHDPDRRGRRCAPTCSCACPAASSWWSTRRSRSTPTCRRSRPTSEEERELHAARHARQTREHIAKLASKGYQRQFDSTPEFVVMFVPSDGIYQAALAAGPGADRVRRPAAGADGHADDPDRPAVGGPLRLAPGADRRSPRARSPSPRASCTSRLGPLRGAASRSSAASSTRPSAPTTRRSAPSTTA